MLTIYHSRRARSVRVIWLCEELGLEYALRPVAFNPDALGSSEYRALHPLGQIPVVQDGDITLYESGAILEYVLERYAAGRLAPAPSAFHARAEYLQWFHFGEATLAKCAQDIVRARFYVPEAERVPEILPQARQRYASALSVAEAALQGRKFSCGSEFTAADIMLSYGITIGKLVGELPQQLPNLTAYLGTLKQRPGYERAWNA